MTASAGGPTPNIGGAILRALLSSLLQPQTGGGLGGGTAAQNMQGPMGQLGAAGGTTQGAVGAAAGSAGPTAMLGADGQIPRQSAGSASPGTSSGLGAQNPPGAALGPLLSTLLGQPHILGILATLFLHTLAQNSKGASSSGGSASGGLGAG